MVIKRSNLIQIECSTHQQNPYKNLYQCIVTKMTHEYYMTHKWPEIKLSLKKSWYYVWNIDEIVVLLSVWWIYELWLMMTNKMTSVWLIMTKTIHSFAYKFDISVDIGTYSYLLWLIMTNDDSWWLMMTHNCTI